jgi:hypothetical protein
MVEQVSEANRREQGIPVKLEHSWTALGRVVSSWENRGALDFVLEITKGCWRGPLVPNSYGTVFAILFCVHDRETGDNTGQNEAKSCWCTKGRC